MLPDSAAYGQRLKKPVLSLIEGLTGGVLGPLLSSRTNEYAPGIKAPAALPDELFEPLA